MAGRSRLGASALLAVSSVAAAFAALEIGLRWLAAPETTVPPAVPEAWRDLPELRTVHQLAAPRARGINAGVLFETNAAGFRGPERSREKPAGVFRIVVTGDSVTMGSGVLAENAYPARLERALRPAAVEVLNVGLSGLRAGQAIDRLEAIGLRFDPDLLVYGYTLNDIEGPAYRRSVDPAMLAPERWAGAPLALARLLGPRVDSLRELAFRPRGSYLHELDENYGNNPAAWHDVAAALDRLARLTARVRVCAVVFLHTRLAFLHAFHPFTPFYDRVAEAAAARGLHVVASLPVLRGHRAESLWVSPEDPHPNATGHALLARALLAGLESLPPACFPGESPVRRPR